MTESHDNSNDPDARTHEGTGAEPTDEQMDRRLIAAASVLRSATPEALQSARPNTDEGSAGNGLASVSSLAAAQAQLRRSRFLSAAAVVAALALLAAGIGGVFDRDPGIEIASGPEPSNELAAFLAELPDQPVDPRDVTLESGVRRFDSCDALLDDLRRVGAEHVGSRGFGSGYSYGYSYGALATTDASEGTDVSAPAIPQTTDAASTPGFGKGGETLGTNVQIDGVDELDTVKAVDEFVYTVRGGRLRIADTSSETVASVTDLDLGDSEYRSASSSELLVSGDRLIVFGNEYVQSKPVEGDPSAATSTESYTTITTVDVSDRTAPRVTDRSRIEGQLVSARLVGDEVRMVTGWTMTDIGFVIPTSAESIPTALETNRRSLAVSEISDWIPEWDNGGEPQPIMGCGDVWVPDTFAGVSMTSMINFTVGDAFEPNAAGLLAPSDVIYATPTDVVISATVWVDPSEQLAEDFDDWNSAVHQFSIEGGTPSHVASGQVDGSIGGQFNFGSVGDRLAVVSHEGTPWFGGEEVAKTTLSIFEADGTDLIATGSVDDISDGAGGIAGIRFTATRALVTVGLGNTIKVIDLSDPADPHVAGEITIPGTAGYIHPITDEVFVTVGNRPFSSGDRLRSAAHTELIATTDPTAPLAMSNWDQPNASTPAQYDHHAFAEWATKELMMFAVNPERVEDTELPAPPYAVFVSTALGSAQVAAVTPRRVEVAAPCPEIDLDPQNEGFGGNKGMDCGADAGRAPDWPGWACGSRFGYSEPGVSENGQYICSPLRRPTVTRVLVVNSIPWIYTDQSLERLDPETFAASTLLPIA